MYHFTVTYVTEESGGLDTPISECPRFHTHADNNEQAIQDLYDSVPDVLSGMVTKKIKVTRRTV